MPRLPASGKIAGVGVPAAGGGYWLAHLVGVSAPQALIIGGVLLTITVVTSITAILPRIIEIISDPEAREAKSEADALRRRTKGDYKIARRAAKKATVEQVILILRQRAISSDLPEGRRLPDDVLDRQQALPRSRPTSKESSSAEQAELTRPGQRPRVSRRPQRSSGGGL